MINSLSKKTQNEIYLASVGIIAVGSFVGWNFFVSPLVKQSKLLETEKRNTVKKEAVLRNITYSEKKLSAYDEALSSTKEITWLIEALNRMASESSLTLVSAAPAGDENRGDYKKITLQIEARGGYHALGDFVSRVENSTRFIKISSCHLELPQDGNDVKGGLKILMSLSVFSVTKTALS